MDPGLLQIYALASPSVPVDSLEKEIWQEVDSLVREPLPQAELEKTKKQARAYFLQSLQTLFFKGLLAGIYQIRAGDFRLIYTLSERYDSLTAEDVLRAARKYLRPENRTVVTLQPVSQKEHEEFGELE